VTLQGRNEDAANSVAELFVHLDSQSNDSTAATAAVPAASALPDWHIHALECGVYALQRAGNFSAAMQVFNSIPPSSAQYGKLGINTALRFRELSGQAYAIAVFEHLMAISADRSVVIEATFERAATYHLMNDFHTAQLGYTAVLELEASHSGALMNLAGVKQVQGDVLGAIDDMKALLATGYTTVSLLNNLGTCLGFSGHVSTTALLCIYCYVYVIATVATSAIMYTCSKHHTCCTWSFFSNVQPSELYLSTRYNSDSQCLLIF
jgi:hypothetical protein